ncbi:hypothetical protein ACFWR9_11315 [Streptomyces sp. NPDC058534]|uniref:hypothetical protein n=1 Tax=Streptomyces sp. NPDC058534 TaxID=3346541 RepID=UPI003652BE11
MAVLTTEQVFIIGVLGGIAGVVGLALAVALICALYLLVARIHDGLTDRREKRRALRDGRRQLATLTTIDDLKDRP